MTSVCDFQAYLVAHFGIFFDTSYGIVGFVSSGWTFTASPCGTGCG